MGMNLINTEKLFFEAVNHLVTQDRLAHDTETFGPQAIGGLHPFHGSRSFSHIFADKNDEFYFDFNNCLDWKLKPKLQPIFDNEERLIFYVNAIFDGCISYFDGLTFKNRICDWAAIARVEYNRHQEERGEDSFLSMDYLCNYYKIGQKDKAVEEYIKEHDLYQKDSEGKRIKDIFKGKIIPEYQKVPLELIFPYGCSDARNTFDGNTKTIKCINYKDGKYQHEKKMIEVAKNEILLLPSMLDAKIKGVRHWNDYTNKAISFEQKILNKTSSEVQEITGGINLNSGKQVAEFLISKGVEVPRKAPTDHSLKLAEGNLEKAKIQKDRIDSNTLKPSSLEIAKRKYHEHMQKAIEYKKGNYITDKKTLAKIIEKHPDLDFISKITTAKEAEKKLNTYYKNFQTLQDENNYIHAELNQSATITGRFSSSNPNLQNLEKHYVGVDEDEYAVRKSIIADEGCRLFMVDYSQQEMIVMLDQAEEMPVIEKLKSGEYKDFYLAVKAILFELLKITLSRYDVKQIALALAYGLGLLALAKNLKILPANPTEDDEEDAKREVKEFKANFFKALPKLKKFDKGLQRQIKMYGKIHNAFGRVIYIDKDYAYKALNAFVQSTSADITKTAIIKCDEEFKKAGLKSRFSICVHDELIFNIAIGEEAVALPIIKRCMRDAYPHKHIQLDVDFEYAPINKYGVSSWGEKQAWPEEVAA